MSDKTHGLSGKRIVLTGATGGVGRATAERLASAGARLALIGRRPEPLAELAAKLGAEPLAGDVTSSGFVSSLPSALERAWGGPADVLINNAGAFELSPLVETRPEAFQRVVAVNLQAAFELTRVLLPPMLARGTGHVVNIGSIAGRSAFPGNAAYSASKFGLLGLHRVMVEELRGTGVKASWIEPAAVDTPLWDPLDPDSRSDLPSRADMLKPEAVADAVYFAVAQPQEVNIEEIAIRANPPSGG
ncbi:MAG TPA: SDR family oxidoreductase [Gemmatimonadota bacterium]|nr:SDR family oxidoreductase [Gemmatimonadota bacterium]